jgi:hypothetical protein
MKYFTIEELCQSDVATKKGITNKPTGEQADNMVKLIENVLDPLRSAWGKPIIVNSGFRSATLNRAVGGAMKSEHCFDINTEVLTDKGWKNYETINAEDNVYSYNLESDIIELKPIQNVIKYNYNGDVVRVKSKQIDLLVTDEHRMVVCNLEHRYKRITDRELTIKEKKYFDSLKTNNHLPHIELAKDVVGKRKNYISSGVKKGIKGDINFYKMCLAVIADGFFDYKRSSVSIGFRFKKERKCKQLELLLGELNWYFTKRLDKHGVYNYYIRSRYAKDIYNAIGKDKHIPLNVLEFDSATLEELVRYYVSYDGHSDKRNNNTGMTVNTVKKHNADLIQAMCVLSNMRCINRQIEPKEYKIKGKCGMCKTTYYLSITPNKKYSRVKEDSTCLEKYNGIVWCVNNENTTLIARRNGRECIQGNCQGKAADITTGTKGGNKMLFNLAKELNLPFRQLIDEKQFAWIHISYDENDIKRQVLSL